MSFPPFRPFGGARVNGGDSDAAAFIVASGITDPTQVAAIQSLVGALKSASLWTKLQAIWPFVGGTASAHKWNLKDPRDLDAAFRLTFAGTWTHSSTGAKPNGAPGTFAETVWNPSTQASATDIAFGFYSRTDSNAGQPYDIGNDSGADANATILIARYENNRSYFGVATSAYPSIASSDGRGFWATCRAGDGVTRGYLNGALVMFSADGGAMANSSLYLAALHRGSSDSYQSDKEHAFTFVGGNLTSGEQSDLYTAVQAYQTTLGRQV